MAREGGFMEVSCGHSWPKRDAGVTNGRSQPFRTASLTVTMHLSLPEPAPSLCRPKPAAYFCPIMSRTSTCYTF